jgi:hypothetical protein
VKICPPNPNAPSESAPKVLEFSHSDRGGEMDKYTQNASITEDSDIRKGSDPRTAERRVFLDRGGPNVFAMCSKNVGSDELRSQLPSVSEYKIGCRTRPFRPESDYRLLC